MDVKGVEPDIGDESLRVLDSDPQPRRYENNHQTAKGVQSVNRDRQRIAGFGTANGRAHSLDEA